MTQRYCIDLFAGAGGLSIGLEMAGFQCLYANEVSPSYSETLKRSHPNAFVETDDVTNVDAASVRRSLQLSKGELTLLAGGPPCQGFSVNAPVRSKDDRRNHLFREYLRFVEEFQPEAILIENVPGIVSFEKGQTVREIMSALKSLGYNAAIRILFAAHYGVPQMRWRTIIVGNRSGKDPSLMYPIPQYKAKGRPNFSTVLDGECLILSNEEVEGHTETDFNTVWDAISDLPEIENGGSCIDAKYSAQPSNTFQKFVRQQDGPIENHTCAGLGKVNLERLPHIPQGGSWRDIPFDLLPKGMKRARRSDHTKRYGRLHPDGLSSTILTKCDPHWGSFIHPTQERVISVREAARIQSFPDHIQFFGSVTEQYEQVGNAVPPLLAMEIGNQIRDALEVDTTGAINSPWQSSQMELSI